MTPTPGCLVRAERGPPNPTRCMRDIGRTNMTMAPLTDTSRAVSTPTTTFTSPRCATARPPKCSRSPRSRRPPAGYACLLGWMNDHATLDRVGVESTGSWGEIGTLCSTRRELIRLGQCSRRSRCARSFATWAQSGASRTGYYHRISCTCPSVPRYTTCWVFGPSMVKAAGRPGAAIGARAQSVRST